MNARTFDAIVLGLGGIGSGAAYWLARTGVRVLGIEQFELGHVRGESHDHSRIIRLSYHERTYVALAKAAYAAWSEVEREAGEQLVHRTGGLDLGPRDGAIPLAGYAASMRSEDVPFEELDASQIRARWPQFRIGDDVHGLFQADGGIVAAARATAAHQRLARAHGATLLERTPVRRVAREGEEFVVATDAGTFAAGKLIVAAGPWSNVALAWFGRRLPLEVTKEQVQYFAPPDLDAFALGTFPVWIWMDDPSFYGFPVFGERAVKVTQDAGGQPVDPDARTFEADAEILARTRAFLQAHLPAALGPEVLVKTCLYTLTPDRDFVIDAVPGYPGAYVAVGAGHAFKFASVIGRLLCELACDGRTPHDIRAFSVDRAVLKMKDPPRAYMV